MVVLLLSQLCIIWTFTVKRFLFEQVPCHSCLTGFTQVARKSLLGQIFFRIFCKCAHVHSKNLSTKSFHKILLSAFRGALTNCFSTIFKFGQISKLKMGLTFRKIIKLQNPTNMQIYNNVSRNSVELYQRSCTEKLFL